MISVIIRLELCGGRKRGEEVMRNRKTASSSSFAFSSASSASASQHRPPPPPPSPPSPSPLSHGQPNLRLSPPSDALFPQESQERGDEVRRLLHCTWGSKWRFCYAPPPLFQRPYRTAASPLPVMRIQFGKIRLLLLLAPPSPPLPPPLLLLASRLDLARGALLLLSLSLRSRPPSPPHSCCLGEGKMGGEGRFELLLLLFFGRERKREVGKTQREKGRERGRRGGEGGPFRLAHLLSLSPSQHQPRTLLLFLF